MSRDQVLDLMDRAAELPYGEARTMLVEEALRHAEATGDERLAYQVRAELRVVYVQGGETAKAFAAFSRCLSDYDKDPGRFDDRDLHRLLWAFKGTVNALTGFPEVPLDRTRAVLDDMERRYRQNGEGMQPVHAYRCVVAMHVGETAAADDWYARWNTAPRTRLSDCIGCDPGTKVEYLAWRGRDLDVIELARPVLAAELTCSEQPQTILTELLPVLLRGGKHEEAADAHRRAYRVQRTRLSELWAIGAHLEFCARSGNEARGLEILERHLGWLDRAPTPHAAMTFAAAAALLLRRLAETGHRDVRVRRPAHRDRPAAEVPAAELRAELAGFALDMVARFDARNGTAHQGDRVRATLDAEPLIDHLPLAAHAARRPAPPATPAAATPAAANPAGAPPTATDADPDALLDAAEESWRRQDTAAALAAWRLFDERLAGGQPTAAQAARRADGAGQELLLGDDVDGALAAWQRAAGLHAAAGDPAREHSAHSRRGAVLVRAGRGDEGLALLEAAAAALDEIAPGTRRAVAARQRLADGLTVLDRPRDALALLDATAATAATGDPVENAGLHLSRARALLELAEDDPEPQVAALRRACAGFRDAGVRGPLAEAALMLGRLLAEREEGAAAAAEAAEAAEAADSADETYELLTEAITHAPAHWPELRAFAHVTRGGWLHARGRAAEAVDDLIEAVAAFTALGMPQAAYFRADLAAAYLAAERHLEAAEVAEEAIPMLTGLGDAQAARRARYLLGCAQRELGEPEEAAGTFTALAADEEEDGPAGQLLEWAGELYDDVGKDGLAAERFAAAAGRYAAADDPIGIVRTRRRHGMSLMWSGHPDRALEPIKRARAVLEELSAAPAAADFSAARTWHGALVGYDEARILAALSRLDEARSRASEAVEAFTQLEEKEAAQAAQRLRDEIAAESGRP